MAYKFKRKPLSIEDQDRLVNTCQTPTEKLVVNGLLETGLRAGELANLTKQNFRWQEGIILLDGKGGPYGHMTKTRIIPLTRISRAIFENWFAINNKFPVGKRQIEKIVQKLARRAGITAYCCPHVLRHTFAVRTIEKGISTRTLMMVLGHDHLSTTEIYLNISPETVKREFREKWDRIYGETI
jgi:integrase/recombinase XerD